MRIKRKFRVEKHNTVAIRAIVCFPWSVHPSKVRQLTPAWKLSERGLQSINLVQSRQQTTLLANSKLRALISKAGSTYRGVHPKHLRAVLGWNMLDIAQVAFGWGIDRCGGNDRRRCRQTPYKACLCLRSPSSFFCSPPSGGARRRFTCDIHLECRNKRWDNFGKSWRYQLPSPSYQQGWINLPYCCILLWAWRKHASLPR